MIRIALVAAIVGICSGCFFQQLQPETTARRANSNSANSQQNQEQEQEQEQKKNRVLDDMSPLLNPGMVNTKAPKKFRVKFETTKGDFILAVHRDWSPRGADRFYNLVKIGFFEDIAIFRAIEGFMFQFGIHGNPQVSAKWREAKIKDDPRKRDVSNQPGYISFATAGKDTRTTQMFINLGDNARLDGMGFTPFGKVVEGMDVVRKINTEYGENPRDLQRRFQEGGNDYIKKRFPRLDFIKSVSIIEDEEQRDDQ